MPPTPYTSPEHDMFGNALPPRICSAEVRLRNSALRYGGCKRLAKWRCEVRDSNGGEHTLYYCDRHVSRANA